MSADMIFRNALFGGFHKEDVLKYIESMQREFVEQLQAAGQEDTQNAESAEHIRTLEEQLASQEKRFSALAELNDEYCRQIYLLEEQVAGFARRFDSVEEECSRLKKVEAQIGALLVDAVVFSDRVTQKAQQAAQEVSEQAKKTIEETAQDVGHISRDIAEISADFSRDVAKLVERIETLSDSLTSFVSKFDRESCNPEDAEKPYAHQESFAEFFSQFRLDPSSEGRPEDTALAEDAVNAGEPAFMFRGEEDETEYEQTNITPEELGSDPTLAPENRQEDPQAVQELSSEPEETTVIESGFARSLDAFNKSLEAEEPASGDDIAVIASEEAEDNSELLADEEPGDDLPQDGTAEDEEPFAVADDEDSGEEDEVAVDDDIALTPTEEINVGMSAVETEPEEDAIPAPVTEQQEEPVDSVSEEEPAVEEAFGTPFVEEDNTDETSVENESKENEIPTHDTLEQEDITESEPTDDITAEALPVPGSEQGEEADEVKAENPPDECIEAASPSDEEETSESYNEAISEQGEEHEVSEQDELELPVPTDPHRELTDEEINDLLRLFSDEEYDIDEAFSEPPYAVPPVADGSSVTTDKKNPDEDDQ